MIDRERIADLISESMNRYAPGDNSPRGALLRAADAILDALAADHVKVDPTPRAPFYPAATLQATNEWRRSRGLAALTWEEYDPDGVMDPERPGQILHGFKVIQDPANPTIISDEAAHNMVARDIARQVARAQTGIANSLRRNYE